MLIRKIIFALLGFYAFEIKRACLRELPSSNIEVRVEWSYEKKKRKEKKKTKQYGNSKWKKEKKFIPKNFKIQGTHAKDVRFSNQRKLRRMYRNT